jgi:hypothetical protein
MSSAGDICRLCGSDTQFAFSIKTLAKYDVRYFQCTGCGSLQTEPPYWLQEAYDCPKPHPLDVGAAQRTIRNHAFISALCGLFKIRRVLDFGGGDGLLCRLLRDSGLDAQVFDQFATSTYGGPFTAATVEHGLDLVTAFEVFEHLPDPRATFQDILGAGPKFLLGTTEVYSGQGPEWRYFVPTTGQHVFFYSRHGLEKIARKHGYVLYSIGEYWIFTQKPMQTVRRKLLSLSTKDKAGRIWRGIVACRQGWYYTLRDLDTIAKSDQN